MKTNSNKNIIKKIAIFLLIVGILIVIAIEALKTFVFPRKYFNIIANECVTNNIDPYLVLAVIKAESGFNEDVTSSKEAKGLMQIIDSTAEEMYEDDLMDFNAQYLYNEELNIALGTKYLGTLIKRYNGNYYLAIIAYNAGMGNVDKWIEQGIIPNNLDSVVDNNIPFKETKNYLKKVINYYKIYRVLY